jgi:hypothetical protein
MTAIVDGLKVVWDGDGFVCAGHGFVFTAWFAGTPRVLEAKVFRGNTGEPGDLYGSLEIEMPDGMPSEEDVAAAFAQQLRLLQAL